VIDKSGKARELSSGFLTLQGLAWSPDEKEIWYTGTRTGANRALYAVTLAGKERVVARVPGNLTLWDIGPKGQALITQAYERTAVMAMLPGANQEADFSWFDYGIPAGFSSDGKSLLIAEVGEGGGTHYSSYLRLTDGSAAIRLGEGQAEGFSPDGKYATSRVMGPPNKLYLLPTQGTPKELPTGAVDVAYGQKFIPGSRKFILIGTEPGHKSRAYLLDPDSGALPKAVTPEGVTRVSLITNDANFMVAQDEKDQFMYYPVAGGAPRPIPGMQPGEQVLGIGGDDLTLYIGRAGELPLKVYRLNVASGDRQLWKEIGPADRTGTEAVLNLAVQQDGKSYYYVYLRSLSELFVFKGLE
jgi:dipeptidyl aminopeptidase/acylaminoacyl peptidase